MYHEAQASQGGTAVEPAVGCAVGRLARRAQYGRDRRIGHKEAGLQLPRATIEMQRTQLDYLTIRAPITGRTGSMTAKLGALARR